MRVKKTTWGWSPLPLRQVRVLGFVIMGVAVLVFGSVASPQRLPVAQAACSGQNLYLGGYYLLTDDGSHPDFEQVLQELVDVPGQLQPSLVNGLPVPTAPNPPLVSGQPGNTSIRQFDWYSPQYQAFTRLDNNPLAFSNDNTPNTQPYFGPGTTPAASAALPATKNLFAAHWHANLVAPPGGLTIPYSFALDDAGWVFLDGQLQIDHGGIHPPATFTGNFVIPAGSHVIDIFFADRHSVNAVTNFQLGNLGALLDCGSPNLSLVKSVQPNDIVRPGDLITYTVQVANTGNYTATNTLVRDGMPANTSLVSVSPAPVSGPTPGGNGELVWNVGTLLPGQSRTVSFVARVNPNTPPALAISNAALGSANESGGLIFRSNGVSNLVDASAALSMNKTASPPPGSNVNVNDLVEYTITVSNQGNVATGSVIVEDPIPAGTVFVSASPAVQSNQNNRARWVVPPIPPNGSTTLTLRVRVVNGNANGLLQNRASASSSGLSASSPLVTHKLQNAADTSANKFIEGFDAPLAPGSFITYTLEASNAGPNSAVSTVLTDTIPPGLEFVSSTPLAPTQAGSLLTWNLGDLAAGERRLLTVVMKVAAGFPGPFEFSNRAGIRSNTPDIFPANNEAVADVPGNNAPVDAQVIKSGPAKIGPNDTFTYELRVSSTLGGDNIVVTDTLPIGLTLVPEQTYPPALGPLADGRTYYWNLGRFEPGDQRIISLVVKANGLTPGNNLTNEAQIRGGRGPARPPAGNSSASTGVVEGSNLSIAKRAVSESYQAGGKVSFVITVTNNAPTPSSVVTVTDVLPPSFTLDNSSQTPPASSTATRLNPDGTTTVFWRFESVPTSGAVINLTVNVPGSYNQNFIENFASLQTETPNGDPRLTSPPSQIPRFGLAANLRLTKDSATQTLQRGQPFAYTIVVNNSGPIEARDVTVTDPLPAGLTFISAQPAPASTNPLMWKLGNLPPNNGQASITLLVRLDQNFGGRAISNGASVTTLSGNSNQANSTVVKVIPINAPPASATPAGTPLRGPTATPTPNQSGGQPAQPTNTPTRRAGGPTATASTSLTPRPGSPGPIKTATVTATPATTGITTTSTPGAAATPGIPGLPNTGIPPDAPDTSDGLLRLGLGLVLIGLGLGLLIKRRRTQR